MKRIPFWVSLLAVLAVIFDLGFDQSAVIQKDLLRLYRISILVGIVSTIFRYYFVEDRPRYKVWPFDALLVILLTGVMIGWNLPLLEKIQWLYTAVFAVFVREFSALKFDYSRHILNPAQLFIISFLSIILTGTLLLILPNSTHDGITPIDAFFTSTSAVCVTGLIVVDTGSYFTKFGQVVIILLIQAGGLGIMTFTSYFSYFFKGGSSYENQLLLKDITMAEKMADVFTTLKRIILVTFIIETIGGVLIYTSLDTNTIPPVGERIFFSIFHAVSGFCNAGFSTLPNSLYEPGFRFNYPLHLVIATLFIIGGIGFPILFNFSKYLKYKVVKQILRIREQKTDIYLSRIININSRIVIITTIVLITLGTILFYFFEYDNTLAEHHGFGKVVTAFFGAVTPRTAGFNSVDTSVLNFWTIMFVFLLMWIGASPASTGGGIKTSTFSIGILNFISLARGKDRIEYFGREIAEVSVRRAFAIISLSLIVIGAAVFLISSFDSDKDLILIAFECFSAYSTVGLSLGITSELSSASKLVIIITMFIGRVSMLTILIALLRKVRYMKYRYPTEEILIN
ncbi:MAG TPA: potassium transporter TrkG [Cyclobacteriaceae bacterium]